MLDALVVAFSSLCEVALCWLFTWLALVPCFASRFSFMEMTFGRMPTLTRRSRTSTFQKNLHGCRRMDPWLLMPVILLFLDTLRPRDIDGSESVAAVCSGLCARLLLSCRELHWSPFERWPFCHC